MFQVCAPEILTKNTLAMCVQSLDYCSAWPWQKLMYIQVAKCTPSLAKYAKLKILLATCFGPHTGVRDIYAPCGTATHEFLVIFSRHTVFYTEIPITHLNRYKSICNAIYLFVITI